MIGLTIKKKERNQKVLILTVCTMICYTPIFHFVNQLCRTIFGTGFVLDTLVCYAVLAGMLLASLKQLHFQIKIDALLIFVIFALAYAISYSFVEENRRYMFSQWTDFASNPLYLLFVYSLPGYVFMRYITDYDRLYETCYIFSLIVVFCSLGSFVLMILRNAQPEYMSFSYNLLFGTIFTSVYFFKKKKALPLIATIIGIVLIFLAGARGPLACYIVSLVICFLLSKTTVTKKTVIVVLLISAGLFIMVLWDQVILSLKNAVDSIGISSRTIDLLLSGDFFSDSSRGEIQQKIVEAFTLFGSGLYGDRVIGENHYAHNLFIELISQWGYLIGTLIIAALSLLIYKGFRAKNPSLLMLIIAFFSASVVKLMFSESYLAHNAVFFVLLAACVNALDEIQPLPSASEPAAPEKKKSKYIKNPGKYS